MESNNPAPKGRYLEIIINEVILLNKPSVEDYLMQGIKGPKDMKEGERKKYLGTLRERVVIVLTQGQVQKNEIIPEVEEAIKQHTKARLLLNGNMDYEHLSKYIRLCEKWDVEYTIVSNKEYESELGLVLAYDHAVNMENIEVNEDEVKNETESKKEQKQSFTNVLKSLKFWSKRSTS